MDKIFFPIFIKVPSILYNAKEAEMTGHKDWIKTHHMINPFMVVSYFNYGYKFNEDEEEKMGMWIQLPGMGVQSTLTIDKFEKLLEENRKLYQ